MNPRILIVDDHAIVRAGIRTLFGNLRPGWEISGEASTAAEGLEAIKNLKPDIVILDITMPGMSGLEAASRIRKTGLGCRVLMFTMHESKRLSGEVRRAGAQGFVLKSQAARDLIRAIDHLLAGGTFFGADSEPGSETEPSPETSNDPVLNSRSNLSFNKCRSRTVLRARTGTA